jgi:hypothetical protein
MMTGEKKGSKEKEGRTCGYKMVFGKPCDRERYDDEHCVFHSKDIEGKKDKFKDAFWKEFERQKKPQKVHDYRGFVFPGDISFEGDVFEHTVIFIGTKFHGVANFRAAQFSGDAVFMGAEFIGKADFGGAKFTEVAYFKVAKFSGGAYFEAARFYGEAYFNEAEFLKKANYNFNRAKFSNDAYFEDIKFENYNSCVMLDTYFYNVIGLFEFIEEDKKKRKKDRIFKYPRLLNRTEFLPDNFRLILGEGTTARYPIISRKIRDDMYLLGKKERISNMSGIRKFTDKTFYFLWWLFADYGRSFMRWAAWCIVFACLFGFVFWGMGTENFKIPEGHSPFAYFYYSIVTFTTLGFGDIVPMTLCGRILVTLEVILGYIGLGGLISILANKLARRS